MTGYVTAQVLREQADLIENPPPQPEADVWLWHAEPEHFAFQVAPDGTAVSLPHQCEDWVIAEGPREYVAEHLADFIRRAQAALDQLNQPEDP
jgi:hypothetical protein